MNLPTLTDLDRTHIIHSVSHPREHEQRGATFLQSASGAYLTDRQGRTLLDGFSGLWCVNAGYGQDSLVEAAARQMRALPYATNYFGYGSEPATLLAQRLIELAPDSLQRVYFGLGRIGCSRLRRAVHHPLLQRDRQAAQEALHRDAARLPRQFVQRRRPDGAGQLPSQLRCSAGTPAPHRLAPSPYRNAPHHGRRHHRRLGAGTGRQGRATGCRPGRCVSSASRCRGRAGSSCHRLDGCPRCASRAAAWTSCSSSTK